MIKAKSYKAMSFDSPLGDILLVSSTKGLRGLYLTEEEKIPKEYKGQLDLDNSCPVNLSAKIQILEYLNGNRRDFMLNLDPKGTAFQLRVWQALSKIPYGQVRTYKDIAQEIGCPNGYRAVGQANGSNPIPIIIPCHRVIASNRGLGGFRYGIRLKTRLLELENDAYSTGL